MWNSCTRKTLTTQEAKQRRCSLKQEAIFFNVIILFDCTVSAYPHRLEGFNLLVQVDVDITGVEQRVSGNLAQQISSKVADVVFAKVPLPQHPAGNYGLRVLVAALAEVAAKVLAVAQPLDVICNRGSRGGAEQRAGSKVSARNNIASIT